MSELIGQAENGGYAEPNLKKSGPFWPSDRWNNYSNQVLTASKLGCARQREIAAKIDQLTSEKGARGEIY